MVDDGVHAAPPEITTTGETQVKVPRERPLVLFVAVRVLTRAWGNRAAFRRPDDHW